MVQQKQRKQLLLTDDKNIFTYYCFQYNRDNPKLRIFSFIPTTTYAAHFYESYIPNSKPNKHNPNNQNNDINVGFTTNTKFVLLQLRQRKFWSIHIQISTNFKKFIFNQFRTFHASPICAFHRSRKICTWLDEQFRTFHPSLHESVTRVRSCPHPNCHHQIVYMKFNLRIIYPPPYCRRSCTIKMQTLSS